MSNLTVNSELSIQAGLSHHRAGRLGVAEGIYHQVLALTPNDPAALHLLGAIAHQTKRYDAAIEFISRAIAIQPAHPAHYHALGNVLKEMGRPEEAIRNFQHAVALRPEFVEALGSLALTMWEANRLDEALACFERASSLKPDNALIQNDAGNLLKVMGRHDEAIERYKRAVSLEPRFAEAYNNLGTVLKETGRLNEAIASYHRALSMKPNLAEAYCNLGDALRATGDWAGAIKACEQAVALKPGLAEAYGNWGNALKDAGKDAESMFRYLQAISMKPTYVEGHNNLGELFKRTGKLDQAIGYFERALELRPEFAEAQSNLGCALWESGKVTEGVRRSQKAYALKPTSANIHSNLIFLMQYDPECGEFGVQQELGRWNLRHVGSSNAIAPHFPNGRSAERRLRVGYISADFWDHVVGRNILPLFRNRNRERFEVFCYYNSGINDALTAEFRSLSDGWLDIRAVNDDQVAEQVRKDQIDILVDLSLHTAGNRLAVLARKPAPVQATFAGYPGSTGVNAIDYRLTDRWLDPMGEGDANYSERSLRLESFWCYEPRGDEPEVNALPALKAGVFTFGSLNNFSKVNEKVLRLWGRVLERVEKSRLLLLAPEGKSRELALRILKECGVNADRVDFEGPRPRVDYFRLYHRMDLGLDTLPYNGHTTSLDSYWMGVPVVTLVGKTVVGRAGLSQLMNLGLGEFVARTDEEFVELAARMAGDLTGLAKLRATLRERMRGSVLMDAPRFTKNIEAAYTEMWKKWTAG